LNVEFKAAFPPAFSLSSLPSSRGSFVLLYFLPKVALFNFISLQNISDKRMKYWIMKKKSECHILASMQMRDSFYLFEI